VPGAADDLLTADAVALLLARSPKSVYRLASDGRLAYVRDGRHVLFRRIDVDDYVREHPPPTVRLPDDVLDRVVALVLAELDRRAPAGSDRESVP
jgi:excisionase family DNA binding protein